MLHQCAHKLLSPHSSLRPATIRLLDVLAYLRFRISGKEQSKYFAVYERCRTVSEYHDFASDILGIPPNQIKSEITTFLDFVRTRSPRHVCEIGTADGGTNFLLSQAVPPVVLAMGIDLYVRNTFQLRRYSRSGQELHYLNGSSYGSKVLESVRRSLAGRSFDLIFIDGDHSYTGVKSDFLCYKEFVREGGLIAFHDIVPDFKTRYGQETGHWAGDVPLFWTKIKALYRNHEFVDNPDQDGLGIGCIEYSSRVEVPADL
jgi:predicted O-methyltransferase YrrM